MKNIFKIFCFIDLHKWNYFFSYSEDSNCRRCSHCNKNQRSTYTTYIDTEYEIT